MLKVKKKIKLIYKVLFIYSDNIQEVYNNGKMCIKKN